MRCIASSLFTVLMIFILTGCMESSPKSKALFLPKDAEKPSDTTFAKEDSLVTLIFTAGKVFHYAGKFNNQTQISAIDYKEVKNVVLDYKNKFGNNLVVMIKPHENATYRNTVDMLDEMTVNDIKRYAMVDLSDEERKKLNLPFPEIPDNAVTVTAPRPVRVNTVTPKTDFVITIHKDSSLSYNDNKKIFPPTKENIKKILSSYKDSLGKEGDRMHIIIRGPKQAAYNSFSPVIQALKELDIFKFSFQEEPAN